MREREAKSTGATGDEYAPRRDGVDGTTRGGRRAHEAWHEPRTVTDRHHILIRRSDQRVHHCLGLCGQRHRRIKVEQQSQTPRALHLERTPDSPDRAPGRRHPILWPHRDGAPRDEHHRRHRIACRRDRVADQTVRGGGHLIPARMRDGAQIDRHGVRVVCGGESPRGAHGPHGRRQRIVWRMGKHAHAPAEWRAGARRGFPRARITERGRRMARRELTQPVEMLQGLEDACRRRTEIEQTGDLVHADRLQTLHERQTGFRCADQAAG